MCIRDNISIGNIPVEIDPSNLKFSSVLENGYFCKIRRGTLNINVTAEEKNSNKLVDVLVKRKNLTNSFI